MMAARHASWNSPPLPSGCTCRPTCGEFSTASNPTPCSRSTPPTPTTPANTSATTMSSSPRPAPTAASLLGQGLRFVTVGTANTLGTLLLYQLLLFVMPYTPAYAIAWGAGLLFVNIAYPLFVYGKSFAGRDSLWNTGYYLLSFAASWLLLRLCTMELGIPPRLSVFCVLAVMVPVNFLVTRYIYRIAAAPRYVKPKRIAGHKLQFRDA